MKLTLFSFGFKYGQPEAEMLWDVRFLPNPYWVPTLREHTGLEKPVADYVLSSDAGQEFVQRFEPLLFFLWDKYKAMGREKVHWGIGCTGGRHRSVAITMHLSCFLEAYLHSNDELVVYHRDIEKG